MKVDIRIPTPLKKFAGNEEKVSAEGKTVGDALHWLTETYPGLRERLRDEHGRIRQFVNVYVNEQDIRFLQNLETPLNEGDQLYIIPAIAGGSFGDAKNGEGREC